MQKHSQNDAKSTNDVNSGKSEQQENVATKKDESGHRKGNATPLNDGEPVTNKNHGVSTGKKRFSDEENRRPLL